MHNTDIVHYAEKPPQKMQKQWAIEKLSSYHTIIKKLRTVCINYLFNGKKNVDNFIPQRLR